MEVIKSFDFNSESLTVYGTADKPMFKAREVGEILDIKNIRENLKNIPERFKVSRVSYADTKDIKRLNTFITEPALYMLAFKSHKEEAIKFTSWICEEVLPSIRKTGEYQLSKPNAYITLPSKFNLNCERDYRIKLITYLRNRRENNMSHLIFTGSMGELLKGETYDIRKEATMTGYEKGSWDVVISTPNKKYSGCYIEIKYGNNQLSAEQKQSIKQYKQNNYKIVVSNEWTDLQRKVDEYLRDIRIPCEFCKCRFKNNKTLLNHRKYFHRITHDSTQNLP